MNLRELMQNLTAHGQEPHAKFAKGNALFMVSCELAGIEPTRRQASKFRNHKGRAWPMRIEAVKKIQEQEGTSEHQ